MGNFFHFVGLIYGIDFSIWRSEYEPLLSFSILQVVFLGFFPSVPLIFTVSRLEADAIQSHPKQGKTQGGKTDKIVCLGDRVQQVFSFGFRLMLSLFLRMICVAEAQMQHGVMFVLKNIDHMVTCLKTLRKKTEPSWVRTRVMGFFPLFLSQFSFPIFHSFSVKPSTQLQINFWLESKNPIGPFCISSCFLEK